MLTEKNDYFDSMGAFSSFSPDDPEKKKGNNGYEAYHGGDTLVNGGNNGVYRQTRKHLGADIRNAKINLDGSGFNKKYNMIDSDGRLRSFRDYHAISKRWVRGEAGEDDNIEERNKMRTTYSTTDTAFNDIAGEYYKNVVVGNFKKNRAATKKLNCIKEDKLISRDELSNLDEDYEFVSYDNIAGVIKPNIDVLKIINKHINDKGINPHNLNPNYLKLTEAEENKLKND